MSKAEQLKYLINRDKRICWICVLDVDYEDASRDHLIPRSMGGPNSIWNIRLAHRACNNNRGQMPPPMEELLKYCNHSRILSEIAIRLFNKAYPDLKTGRTGRRRRGSPPRMLNTNIVGPRGHEKYSFSGCEECEAYCIQCKVCWCLAGRMEHRKD